MLVCQDCFARKGRFHSSSCPRVPPELLRGGGGADERKRSRSMTVQRRDCIEVEKAHRRSAVVYRDSEGRRIAEPKGFPYGMALLENTAERTAERAARKRPPPGAPTQLGFGDAE